MTETKLTQPFEKALHQAGSWIEDLRYELNLDDPVKTYQALRVTLLALRDRLPMNEAAHLGAQLPMIIRGGYYDGWKIREKPVKLKSAEDFFAHMEKIHSAPLPVEADTLVRAVFKLLRHRITLGEIEDIESNMPAELKELWPHAIET